MHLIFDYLFSQYSSYETLDIVLEIVAVILGLCSVWFSKQNSILVYPTGMASTAIFVYLLLKWGLLGDMLINSYYFIMSIYGWYIWTRKTDGATGAPITTTNKREKWMSILLFFGTLFLIACVYNVFDKWTSWTAYVDTFTTGIFFVGMWLMAKRKLENWIFWIIGDLISIPLYFYKGFTFTSFQYLIFTILAFYGYSAWKKNLNSSLPIL